jgi:hypothetical protein
LSVAATLIKRTVVLTVPKPGKAQLAGATLAEISGSRRPKDVSRGLDRDVRAHRDQMEDFETEARTD